ncbi:MAG: hypothetical protein EA424_15470 [Planctomycetaceae bacterium]|nr:MAG: hypothetical protein EA424_15470 [Planctomycetaceae bacterium]
MTIQVVCPGCKKRFSVDDKFAGKQGPCPKCKTVIKVPDKTDDVVVHEPEGFGPKDKKGRAVLKPIERTETKFSPVIAGVAAGSSLLVLLIAVLFRGQAPTGLLVLGAILLAPPLVWAGYAFLRDEEYEPFVDRELWIRVGACSLVYALLWGLVPLIAGYGLQLDQLELVHMAFLAPVLIGLGAFTAYASLDFDFGMGAMHYGLYLSVTVLLRLVLGLTPL